LALKENYHPPGFPELYSFFDSFPKIRGLLAVHGTIGLLKRIPEYAALSYVWGGQPDNESSEQGPSADNTGKPNITSLSWL
jgi:hypothetical protein